MGKRARATKASPNQLLQYVQKGESESFAKSLVGLRVRISKVAKSRGKPSVVREGLVRRAENEVYQKDATAHMRNVSWQIDVIFPAEHVQCVFYVVDFLQPNGSAYFQEDRPVGDGTFGQKEWTLELIPDDGSPEMKTERKRELDKAIASLHFKGGCANAKGLIAERGEQALLKQRICFWWPYEQEWYSGVIESVHLERHSAKMLIIFDDGDSLTRSISSSIWRLETTALTDENKEASIDKALAPPSLQEAMRPHTLKAVYKAAPIRVEKADQQALYVCTVDAGCRNKSGAQPDVQVGTTSEHTVAIITQGDPLSQQRHEYAFVFPEQVSSEDMQATIGESGKVRISVPVRLKKS